MDDSRINEGKEILEAMWYSLAGRIVQLASQVYQLTAEQEVALRDVFLRPNDYPVHIRNYPK
jgi:predicted metal-dependent hydrolase